MMLISAALAPLLALLYDEPELIAPMLALALILPGLALQSPIWVFYRRMDFLRQRLLTAVDPIVGFVVTIALADRRARLLEPDHRHGRRLVGRRARWPSRTASTRCGCASTARTLRELRRLLVAAGRRRRRRARDRAALGLLGDAALGLAGAGAIGLAATFSAYTDRVDAVITQALYPAICRVAERRDLLFEAFMKSNRLALMWGVPFGIGARRCSPPT